VCHAFGREFSRHGGRAMVRAVFIALAGLHRGRPPTISTVSPPFAAESEVAAPFSPTASLSNRRCRGRMDDSTLNQRAHGEEHLKDLQKTGRRIRGQGS